MKLVHPSLVDFVQRLQGIAQKAEDRGLFRATDHEELRQELDRLVTDVQCCDLEPRGSIAKQAPSGWIGPSEGPANAGDSRDT